MSVFRLLHFRVRVTMPQVDIIKQKVLACRKQTKNFKKKEKRKIYLHMIAYYIWIIPKSLEYHSLTTISITSNLSNWSIYHAQIYNLRFIFAYNIDIIQNALYLCLLKSNLFKTIWNGTYIMKLFLDFTYLDVSLLSLPEAQVNLVPKSFFKTFFFFT